MAMNQKFLTEEQCRTIEAAIERAESQCSGEIRVHVDEHCSRDILEAASQTFARLKMHKTELRNGVLFYIASEDKKFAVIGDKGINSKVAEGFWDDVCGAMTEHFKEGDFVEGIVHGIRLCGEKLSEHFPHQENDINELPNEVTFGPRAN